MPLLHQHRSTFICTAVLLHSYAGSCRVQQGSSRGPAVAISRAAVEWLRIKNPLGVLKAKEQSKRLISTRYNIYSPSGFVPGAIYVHGVLLQVFLRIASIANNPLQLLLKK